MAKRFIDTGILKHHFTRGLPAPYKLLWVHLLTDCNHAGMWQVDWDIASIVVGSKIEPEKATKIFAKKIIKIKDGAIWFLPDFIDFQYGTLSEKNQAHKGIISILNREKLLNPDFSLNIIRGATEPLPSPSQGAKDMDKEKEMDKEVEKDNEKGGEKKHETETIINTHPFAPEFYPQWERWVNYKRDEFSDRYKTITSEQTAFNRLVNIAGGDPDKAIQIIDYSIAQHWKGLFKDDQQNGKRKSGKNSGADEIHALAELQRRGVKIDYASMFDKKGG